MTSILRSTFATRLCLLLCVALTSSMLVSARTAEGGPDIPGSIKGTVRAVTGGADSQSAPLPNARLTLKNVNLPEFLLKRTSDELGEFVFENLPAGKYILTVEADGLPTITQTIDLAAGATLVVDVNLAVALSESVVIKNEEGLLSTSESTVSNTVQARTLKTQPFREDEYESALPLTPGVVQDSANNAYVKGSRSGQSNYTVNGADVTDPITGESSFEIPLEAVANIQVEENPYSSEFGSFTGGVTNLQSKGGGDKFNISAARLFPTFHNVASTQIDSFRPRVTFSGPIIKSRLFFLQSFEYRYRRDYVPSLSKPLDHTATERFSSFTQLDYTANDHNQFKFNFALFPQRVRFFGLNTFNPAPATPNTKQRGYLASISEQAVFKNTSFLNSAVSYKTSDLDVFPQGPQPFTLVSDFNRGNYFADTRRKTGRLQWQEYYYFTPFGANGKHSSKIGFEYDRTNISTLYRYNTIFLRSLSNVLTQRVDFTAPASNRYDYNEFSTFIQDRWTVSPALTLDLGLRYDFDGVAKGNNVSPRFSFIWTPSQKSRTVIRGGVGLFFDQTPPVKGYFGGSGIFGQSFVPERTVTTYAPDGVTITDGPRRFINQVSADIRSPRSVRWSMHIDQGITSEFTMRFGYLQRETKNDLIVEPIATGPNTGTLLLSSTGGSRYREFQVLATYINKKYGNWNISYTFSRTEGDLNTADAIVGDFPSFVIRPNEYSRLSFDSPHRFIAYGQVDLPYDIRVAPLFEYRTGFPYSAVNDRLDFVGARNEAGLFPNYLSLDVSITKGFYVPFLKKKYHVRAGAALFDLTNHFNPRDVQNNVNNPFFGQFYNSLDFGIKAKFDIDF